MSRALPFPVMEEMTFAHLSGALDRFIFAMTLSFWGSAMQSIFLTGQREHT